LDAGAVARVRPGDDEDAAVHSAAAAHYFAACWITAQSSSTTFLTIAASSPSAITRMTGSVPDFRMSRRPALAPSLLSAAATAALTPSCPGGVAPLVLS